MGDWAARWRVPVGFAVAAAYLYFAQPTPALLAAGAAIAAVGIALRAVAAGYLRKGEGVAQSGPYAYIRHPLYLGSAFIVAGFAVAAGRAWLGLGMVLFFLALYLPLLGHEEAAMRARYPAEYAAYTAAVPRLFPRSRPGVLGQASARFNWGLYWRNREYNALAGYLGMLLLLWLKIRYGG